MVFFFNRVLQSDHQKVKLYINLFGKVFFEVTIFDERDFLSRINIIFVNKQQNNYTDVTWI